MESMRCRSSFVLNAYTARTIVVWNDVNSCTHLLVCGNITSVSNCQQKKLLVPIVSNTPVYRLLQTLIETGKTTAVMLAFGLGGTDKVQLIHAF